VDPAATFLHDPRVARIAEAYALDAVDFAANTFNIKLDWSDASIERVEAILTKLSESLPTAKPPEDAVWNFAKAFGSYMGEVFRKNHGGEWGMVTLEGKTFPGMRMRTDSFFWPWSRAHRRIVEGSENNVLTYYRGVVAG
jgi:hypothetical protein